MEAPARDESARAKGKLARIAARSAAAVVVGSEMGMTEREMFCNNGMTCSEAGGETMATDGGDEDGGRGRRIERGDGDVDGDANRDEKEDGNV